jgi:ADP-ribosylglycohydrolase
MRALDGEPQMLGGGLGGIAPGQWSDDTELACAIALVSSTGVDLRTEGALDAIAAEFSRWYADEPPDVGVQTRAVCSHSTRPAPRTCAPPPASYTSEANGPLAMAH